MRSADYINNIWNGGGPFTGEDGKPHTRVTVQRNWPTDDDAVRDGDEDHVIHPTWTKAGSQGYRGLPLRWYQKDDNSQIEQEIPNVKQVTIDRSIETDAAKCSITLYNQWMYDNGAVPLSKTAQGNRHLSGYFTAVRGSYPEGQARWGQEANEWENTLVPNAVLRTYQGYGGHSKTLEDCLADGNLILTGVWLVDEVRVATNGELDISCRDMAKLLIDQHLYPPLVPSKRYPLTYYRWKYESFKIKAGAKNVTTSTSVTTTIGNKRCVFRDSEVDRWYPKADPGSAISSGGFLLHGHQGKHAVDGKNDTYYLGVGNAGPDRDFSVMWIEFSCGEYINAVYMKPWAGNYTMYISVYENGEWQGTGTVPYSESELYAGQDYVVDTGADIRYVAKYGVPWETGKEYKLPRYFKADRVRITFRHLTYSGIGPWMYRGGIREVKLRSTQATKVAVNTQTQTLTPVFWAAASKRDPADLNSVGYITVSNLNQTDAFGDCRVYNQTGGDSATSAGVYWISLKTDGTGYWKLFADGAVTAHGSAAFYGSPKTLGIGSTGGRDPNGGRWQCILPTPTNLGYWCVAVDGRIRAFGDAADVGGVPSTIPGFVHASDNHITGGGHCLHAPGFYATAKDGTVYNFGAANHYGNLTGSGIGSLVVCQPTMAGDGYWLMTGMGVVQAKGAAVDFGEQFAPDAGDWGKIYDQLMPTPSDDGYYMLKTFGTIVTFGDANFFGSPVPGTTGQIRKDGNYKDYADIIRDLALWSGFLLYDEDIPATGRPDVFGNIESTGAYAEEQLPDEIFDKRPVIDAMTQIKEVVGYLLYVDDEGGLRFESPNFWSYGNFIQTTGERVYEIPEIDEQVNLLDYGTSRNDESLRSLIIISSEDPSEAGDTTVTTKIVPQTAQGLRGLMKPAMWVNGWFQHEEEQQIMAELIALHIWFAQRLGQVTCVANPAIQINDQVRIYERQTSEVFIHYVRGVNTNHDLDSGRYTMTLTTHWLGSGEDWAITDNEDYVEDESHFVVSPRLVLWLEEKAGAAGSSAGQDATFTLGGDGATASTFKSLDPLGPQGDPSSGAAS